MSTTNRRRKAAQAISARAIELEKAGVGSAAICERLGITRQQLCQIRYTAKQKKAAEVSE